jgi:hypothetical protein
VIEDGPNLLVTGVALLALVIGIIGLVFAVRNRARHEVVCPNCGATIRARMADK